MVGVNWNHTRTNINFLSAAQNRETTIVIGTSPRVNCSVNVLSTAWVFGNIEYSILSQI